MTTESVAALLLLLRLAALSLTSFQTESVSATVLQAATLTLRTESARVALLTVSAVSPTLSATPVTLASTSAKASASLLALLALLVSSDTTASATLLALTVLAPKVTSASALVPPDHGLTTEDAIVLALLPLPLLMPVFRLALKALLSSTASVRSFLRLVLPVSTSMVLPLLARTVNILVLNVHWLLLTAQLVLLVLL